MRTVSAFKQCGASVCGSSAKYLHKVCVWPALTLAGGAMYRSAAQLVAVYESDVHARAGSIQGVSTRRSLAPQHCNSQPVRPNINVIHE